MGGAAGINLLLGMIRVKFAAVLIGTAGVGLLASFTAIQGLLGTLAGLGIQSSAVREVAAAVAKNDQLAIGRAVLTLRRVCWLTGIVGMLAMMFFSPLISQLTFGSHQYTLDIAALGIIILLANLSGGQMALIQGMRRIGDMARAQVVAAALATVVAIAFYSWLGLRGIVPSLTVIAFIQLMLSWYFARRVSVPPATLSWRQTFSEAGGMVKLGLVFMWNGLLGSAVTYFTVTLITQQQGLQAVGLYSAAFALSGMFVNFVLSAMGADYYPRLTGVSHDKAAVNRLVNEQTEIGLLLALPGLLLTLVLAPWIIQLFYTKEFLPAVELLQWFILGCFGRVISWPLGFVMLALGKGHWFFITETSFNLLHILLIVFGFLLMGIEGVAIAFFVMYIGYTIAVLIVARHLIDFSWSLAAKKIGCITLPLIGITFILVTHLPLWAATIIGLGLSLMTSIYCMYGLTKRISSNHPILKVASNIPCIRKIYSLLN